MKVHLDSILASLRAIDPNSTLEENEVPTEAVLAIANGWVLVGSGTTDDKEWDETIDAHFVEHGPSVLTRHGFLYVLAGDWRYPIYWRFEKQRGHRPSASTKLGA